MTAKQPTRHPSARTTTVSYLSLNENLAAKELVEKSYQQERREYDSEGRMIRQLTYHQEGHVVEEGSFEYDETGFLIGETKKTEDVEFVERMKHEAGENGKIAFSYTYYADGSFDTTTFTYDEAGRTLEVRTTDSDGEEEWKELHSYPDAETEIVERTEWEELAGQRIIKRSKHGIVERKVTNAEGDVLEHLEQTFNDEGKLIATRLEEEGSVYAIEYTLNEAGQAVKESHSEGGEGFSQTVENEFDADGNILSQKQIVVAEGRPDGHFSRRYEYEWPEVPVA